MGASNFIRAAQCYVLLRFDKYHFVLVLFFPSLSSQHFQGCALAEPGGPCCLPFALGWPRKSQIFHTNHILGTLDFTVSERWAPFIFP